MVRLARSRFKTKPKTKHSHPITQIKESSRVAPESMIVTHGDPHHARARQDETGAARKQKEARDVDPPSGQCRNHVTRGTSVERPRKREAHEQKAQRPHGEGKASAQDEPVERPGGVNIGPFVAKRGAGDREHSLAAETATNGQEREALAEFLREGHREADRGEARHSLHLLRWCGVGWWSSDAPRRRELGIRRRDRASDYVL
mmetsp:Transcript_19114/g.56759  ORF Transcript_19114/g.56759 Transcript_19114/m.56759 type:complete len:203 (+) Transcript_19114:749-1357(+)